MILNDQKDKLKNIVGNLSVIADCLWSRKITSRFGDEKARKFKARSLFKS